jgi:hypothetical protein
MRAYLINIKYSANIKGMNIENNPDKSNCVADYTLTPGI